MQHSAPHNPISLPPRGTEAAEDFGPQAAGPLGTLQMLARVADSRSGAMLIGVGIVLVLWQFIAAPEIRAAREIDRAAMREIVGKIEHTAELLNTAAGRMGTR